MKLILIDPEPPTPHGGGIRSYIQHAILFCLRNDWKPILYTHSPEVYSNCETFRIGRAPVAKRWSHFFIYRTNYLPNLILEQSNWIYQQLRNSVDSDTIVEFADYLGYGLYSLRNPALREQTILRVHTPSFLITGKGGSLLKWWHQRRIGKFEKECLSKAKQIVAPSSQFVQEKLPSITEHVHVPNFVPFPHKTKPLHFTGQNGLKPNFLYLGRLEMRKGVLVLLKAFFGLQRSHPEARLWLIGDQQDKPYLYQIQSLLQQYPRRMRGKVRFFPAMPRTRIERIIGYFNFLVIPSLWENSPYVFFEALRAKRVCITSDCGEMGKVQRELNGFISPPGNADALMTQMKKGIELGEAALQLIRKQENFLAERTRKTENQFSFYYKFILSQAKNPVGPSH
ncbi:MAG: glycosyltransferase family 4 protein [Okeania sp. SIO1H5]|nr:glycosyltransferase family 4 protein [Okeania sp. SIO1H5]